MLKTNAAGIALIKRFEEFRAESYPCPAGVWTIGYGHVGRGPLKMVDGFKSHGVKPGWRISKAQAEAFLEIDLDWVERDVRLLLGSFQVNENEFSALVSFAFNVGTDIDTDTKPEGLGDSRLLRKLLSGDRAGAAAEFERWVYANGKQLAGLIVRREAERRLFLSPVATRPIPPKCTLW